MLTREIAAEIVKQTMVRLDRNINIMDDRGKIIASGNPDRINMIHEGATEVLRTGRAVTISDKDIQWKNSYPGVNLPIHFQKKIIGVIGITGDPDEIFEFGELVKMITEMMIQQSFSLDQLEWQQKAKDHLFDDLLQDSIEDSSIEQRFKLFEIHLLPPFQVSVIKTDMPKLKKNDFIQWVERFFPKENTLIGFLGINQQFILHTGLTEEQIIHRYQSFISFIEENQLTARIGLGSNVKTVNNVQHSYQQSISALTLSAESSIFATFKDIEAQALLNELSEASKTYYYTRVLNGLSEKLIETLESLFANNLNLGECAKSLFIHRNSLIYRLKKIKEITGYNPQHTLDAITLQLAIWLRQMHKE
ncbi:CdaR family transcriptional regulator [Cytobacillus kochii]